MKLLLIQSSASPLVSYSRKWAKKIVDQLKKVYPELEIDTLDLLDHLIPHLTGPMVAQELKSLELGNPLIDQFLAAELIVIGVPMYNFGIPSALKAYLDQIIRAGRTFCYTPTGPRGMVENGKRVFIAISSGGIYSEGALQKLDFVEPYLKTVFEFLGVQSPIFIRIEGTSLGPEFILKAEENAAHAVSQINSASPLK